MTEILNYLFEKTLVIPFLLGIVFSVTGLIMYLFPPRKINYLYGYRTTSSMKNQEVWDFAQRYSSIKMLQGGLVLIAISLLNLFYDFSEDLQLIIGLPLIILPCIYLFWATEKTIKKNFPNQD